MRENAQMAHRHHGRNCSRGSWTVQQYGISYLILVTKLLAAFDAEAQKSEDKPYLPPAQPLIEPLSQRELEVLHLIAQGLSNREISERLFLALNTVKGHNHSPFAGIFSVIVN
jgi:DNA-binding NarL/FixJ family response regulator